MKKIFVVLALGFFMTASADRFDLERTFYQTCAKNVKNDAERSYCRCVWNQTTTYMSDKYLLKADSGKEPERSEFLDMTNKAIKTCIARLNSI